jgi:hypothetical protein
LKSPFAGVPLAIDVTLRKFAVLGSRAKMSVIVARKPERRAYLVLSGRENPPRETLKQTRV